VGAAARVLVGMDAAFEAESEVLPWPVVWRTKPPRLIYLGLCDKLLHAIQGFILTAEPRDESERGQVLEEMVRRGSKRGIVSVSAKRSRR
jgi:hypothetical protein